MLIISEAVLCHTCRNSMLIISEAVFCHTCHYMHIISVFQRRFSATRATMRIISDAVLCHTCRYAMSEELEHSVFSTESKEVGFESCKVRLKWYYYYSNA